jgi:hypothetical protein
MDRSTHPYRDLPAPAASAPVRLREELILYALLVAIGAIPVVLALVGDGSFGVDATLGLLMMCGGALGVRDKPISNSTVEYR